jgi:branched-chain amino acid transport system permease protein
MLFGAFASAVLGFFTGAISLRMRGMFAICLTWFIGIALMGLAVKMVWLTRGALGLRTPYFFGPEASNLYYWYPVLGVALVTWFILKRIARSHMGLAFKAIGQNMDAAKTSGINPTRYRIMNFTVSCALAGWVGAFYAHFIGILTPDFLHTAKTVEFLVIVYIGGRGSLWGGFAVAFPFIWFTEMLRSNFDYLPGINLLVYGLMLILIMIFYAGGMAQFFHYLADKWKDNPTVKWLTT